MLEHTNSDRRGEIMWPDVPPSLREKAKLGLFSGTSNILYTGRFLLVTRFYNVHVTRRRAFMHPVWIATARSSSNTVSAVCANKGLWVHMGIPHSRGSENWNCQYKYNTKLWYNQPLNVGERTPKPSCWTRRALENISTAPGYNKERTYVELTEIEAIEALASVYSPFYSSQRRLSLAYATVRTIGVFRGWCYPVRKEEGHILRF